MEKVEFFNKDTTEKRGMLNKLRNQFEALEAWNKECSTLKNIHEIEQIRNNTETMLRVCDYIIKQSASE